MIAENILVNTVEEMFCQNPDEIFTSTDVSNFISYVFEKDYPAQRIWAVLKSLCDRGTVVRVKHGHYQSTEV